MNHHLISDSKWSRCCRFPIINVYRSYLTTNVVVLSNSQQIRDPCVFKCTDERRAHRISQSVSQSVRPGSGSHQKPNHRMHPQRQRNRRRSGSTASRHNHIIFYRAMNLVLLFSRSCPWHTFTILIFWSGFVGLRRERAPRGTRDVRGSGGRVLGSARLMKMIEHAWTKVLSASLKTHTVVVFFYKCHTVAIHYWHSYQPWSRECWSLRRLGYSFHGNGDVLCSVYDRI